jgi:hypothetical protein
MEDQVREMTLIQEEVHRDMEDGLHNNCMDMEAEEVEDLQRVLAIATVRETLFILRGNRELYVLGLLCQLRQLVDMVVEDSQTTTIAEEAPAEVEVLHQQDIKERDRGLEATAGPAGHRAEVLRDVLVVIGDETSRRQGVGLEAAQH